MRIRLEASCRYLTVQRSGFATRKKEILGWNSTESWWAVKPNTFPLNVLSRICFNYSAARWLLLDCWCIRVFFYFHHCNIVKERVGIIKLRFNSHRAGWIDISHLSLMFAADNPSVKPETAAYIGGITISPDRLINPHLPEDLKAAKPSENVLTSSNWGGICIAPLVSIYPHSPLILTAANPEENTLTNSNCGG